MTITAVDAGHARDMQRHLARRGWTERGVQRSEPGDWPRCSSCTGRIEGCEGRYGDWMHTATRSEWCADGVSLAAPETAVEIGRRKKGRSS